MSSSSRLNAASSQGGFTLLEVIISLVILTFIALGIYQATTQTFKLRDILSVEGDFYNGIRLSMDILQRDITLLHNPMLIIPPKPKTAVAPANPGNGANGGEGLDLTPKEMEAFSTANVLNETKYFGGVADKTGLRPSRFQGSSDKMSFISASHIRIYKDAPESEFSKIAYELAQETANRDIQNAKTLIKIESPNVYEDEDRKDTHFVRYPLLRGIRKLAFKYFRRDQGVDGTWLDSWDSTNGELKGKYPDRVKVTLEVAGPQKLEFEGEFVFRPEVPLRGLDPSI